MAEELRDKFDIQQIPHLKEPATHDRKTYASLIKGQAPDRLLPLPAPPPMMDHALEDLSAFGQSLIFSNW
eukprot:7423517-Karenia_brevis.AAC.1